MKWPWKRSVTEAEKLESSRQLEQAKQRQVKVDKIACDLVYIVTRNHLAERFHRALSDDPYRRRA